MPIFAALKSIRRIATPLLGPPTPPDQLVSTHSSEHNWWGVELRGQYMRYGNAVVGSMRASNSLAWYFDRPLRFEGTTLQDVSAFLAECRYAYDKDHFGREWWIHPAEFEELKKGDCEDHALWAWRVLHEMGHDVRLMIGLMNGGGHAWVQYYENGRSYIMETVAKSDMSFDDLDDYVPQYSFKRQGSGHFVMFGHKPKMIEEANQPKTEPLSRPEDWKEIDSLIFEGRKNWAVLEIRRALKGEGSPTRELMERYDYLRAKHPDRFKHHDEAYWEDWFA